MGDYVSLSEHYDLGLKYNAALKELKEAREVIKAWMEFEESSIKLDGPYVGKEINTLIKRAREFQEKWNG
ncbi:hypothetical protein D3C87_125470 [compost metagenome]